MLAPLPLPAWLSGEDVVRPVSDPETYLAQYAPHSERVLLPETGPAGRRLCLFEGAPLAVDAGVRCDGVAFVGGPLWALDWCPPAASMDIETSDQFVVVSAHPKDRTCNPVGKVVAGPALLQVWRVPSDSDAPPALALALAHSSGLAWDAKWRPGSGPDKAVLGVVAAALGDGEVVVCAVPASGAVLRSALAAVAGGAPIVHITPLARGRCGMPSTLEWCPRAPHDLLLAACWDGSAVLWRLDADPPPPAGPEDAAQRGMAPLLRVQSEQSPLRCAAWPPPEVCTTYGSAPAAHVFALAGHAADLRLWDGADPIIPRLDVALPREWALGLAWIHAPLGTVVAHDNARLTFVQLDADARGKTGPTMQYFSLPGDGEVWGVHALPGTAVVAYAMAAGDVGVFDVQATVKARGATAHVAVAGWRRETGTLVAPARRDLERTACVFGGPGRGLAPTPAGLPDDALALHRVRWGARCGKRRRDAWLACGGGAGLLRVQLLALDDVA